MTPPTRLDNCLAKSEELADDYSRHCHERRTIHSIGEAFRLSRDGKPVPYKVLMLSFIVVGFALAMTEVVGSLEEQMEIKLVDEESFPSALEVYTASWWESHRDVCTADFLEKRDYAGYLRKKLGMLWMISDGTVVGVFSLDGESFGDLYIHPSHQGRGYGKAAIHFAKQRTAVLRLTVRSNNPIAIGLYEKMSFRFTGNDTFLRDGLWEREMVYTELSYDRYTNQKLSKIFHHR